MVRTIAWTTQMRNPVIPSQVVPPAVTMSISVPVAIAFRRVSSVMTSTIVAMAVMRSVAVSTQRMNTL